MTDISSIRGQWIENAPVGRESWFECGGAADVLFRPADLEDLSYFLSRRDAGQPLHVIGGLANTIIRDGGLRGVTLQLGKAFSKIEILEDGHIQAGAGALNGSVAAAAMKAGIGGLEFLSGIPGSVGGAVAMNAGAYGAEIRDVLQNIDAADYAGHQKHFAAADIAMSYRHTAFPAPVIVTGAVFKGQLEDYGTVKTRMTAIKEKRNATQPIREKTGGSTFANPAPDDLRRTGLPEEMRAWKIVDLVGGRGLRIGGAQMSEMHCNFMVNTGGASAHDLETLGEEIRRRALNQLGLELHWEIKRVGD